jgi:hypothetical protein
VEKLLTEITCTWYSVSGGRSQTRNVRERGRKEGEEREVGGKVVDRYHLHVVLGKWREAKLGTLGRGREEGEGGREE